MGYKTDPDPRQTRPVDLSGRRPGTNPIKNMVDLMENSWAA
jgi:hypothetical protein